MSRVSVPDRSPSKFEVKENALELARQIRELDIVRNFGYKIRMAQIPKNWNQWSEESQQKWLEKEAMRIEKLRAWDKGYLDGQRKKINDQITDMLINIERANRYKRPKTIEEANRRLIYQDEALGACGALLILLEDIMHTLGCQIDKNWLTQIDPLIEKEIALIAGWKKSDAEMRKAVYRVEAERGRNIIRKGVEEAGENMVLRAIFTALGIENEGNS